MIVKKITLRDIVATKVGEEKNLAIKEMEMENRNAELKINFYKLLNEENRHQQNFDLKKDELEANIKNAMLRLVPEKLRMFQGSGEVTLIDENKAKPDSASIAVSHGFVPNFVQLYRAQFGKTEVDKPIKVADFFGRETPSVIPFPKEEIDHDIRRISEWDAPDPSRIKRLEDLRGRKREFEGYEDSQRAEMATDYVHKNLAYGVGGWELSENRWVEGPDEQPLANIERYAHSPHAIEFTQDKSYAQGVVEDGGGVLVEENAPEGRVLNSIMGLRKIFKGIQKE